MNTRQLIQAVVEWPVASQQAARRNALVACTAMTQRRIEREEVDAYLESVVTRREAQRDEALRDSSA